MIEILDKEKAEEISKIAIAITEYVKNKGTDIKLVKEHKSTLFAFSHNVGIAIDLYNSGCRVVTEDMVVLSKKEYEELLKKSQKEKSGEQYSKVVYREIINYKSTEFNKEPPTIKVKYFVVGESKDGKKWLVERAGWRGVENRHYIKKDECIGE